MIFVPIRNPGTDTIEERLLKALKSCELITEESYVRPQLMYFQRAARTDKFVSAIGQVVSLKILESVQTKISEINENLPSDIRLMGCKRVTQAFDAKNFCDARTYSYLMPSYALCPMTDVTKESYRVPDDVVDKFNEILKGYVGTHVFHNFTQGKKFQQDSATRVIRHMDCSKPFFPCNQNDIEFVLVRVKGQSFMMHQIRKMIGLALAVIKGFAQEDDIRLSMECESMDVPKAPGLGLMLEEVHFERYNKRFGGDGHHDPIEWNEEANKIQQFKDEQIYPVVVNTERDEKSMLKWLATLALHSYGEPRNTPEDIMRASLQRTYFEATSGDDKNLDDNQESDRKKVKLDKDDQADDDNGLSEQLAESANENKVTLKEKAKTKATKI